MLIKNNQIIISSRVIFQSGAKVIMARGKKIRLTDNMPIIDRVIVCLAELGGTALLLFLGCLGCANPMSEGKLTGQQMALAFGLAVMISIQVFGHISACHINPAVTVAAAVLGQISLIQIPVYFVGQFIGALCGFGLLVLSTPQDLQRTYTYTITEDNGTMVSSIGTCSPVINKAITPCQGFMVEFLATLILIWLCCGLWDYRNREKQDSTPIKFGLAVAGLSMGAGPYTTAQINPARSLAPALFNGDWDNHWVFWAAPLLAGFVGASIYRLVFAKEPQEDNDVDAAT